MAVWCAAFLGVGASLDQNALVFFFMFDRARLRWFEQQIVDLSYSLWVLRQVFVNRLGSRTLTTLWRGRTEFVVTGESS